MKKTLLIALFALPLTAVAEHMDVIQFKMNEGCTFESYMEIVADFNEWGQAYDYQTKIAVPLQNQDLNSMFWLGTSADAATFGKAWDAWRDAQSDPTSVPAKLMARFAACTTNLARWGYDVY